LGSAIGGMAGPRPVAQTSGVQSLPTAGVQNVAPAQHTFQHQDLNFNLAGN